MRHRAPTFILFLASVLFVSERQPVYGADDTPTGRGRLKFISVQRVRDEAPHNAFSTLIRFQSRWFCAFREAQSHQVGPAAVRIITSADGASWKSVALLSEDGFDLRDPHLSITPRGELMLMACRGIQPSDIASRKFQSVVRFSADARGWTEPIEVGDPEFWLWSASWRQGDCYAFGYDYANRNRIRLYRSTDGGRSFQTLVDDMGDRSYPNETSIVFDDDQTAYCLLRRGGPARLGKSRPPYSVWQWMDTGIGVGGPALLQLPDGRWLAGGRGSNDGPHTILWQPDWKTGALAEVAVLPSGGDTGYPGLVWHDGFIWVSYYSSHEGKTSIYIAKLRAAPQTTR